MQSKLSSRGFTVYTNVTLGRNCRLDYGIILGFSETKENAKTCIGDNAVLRPFTIIYSDVRIGNNFQTGPHVLIREDNILGDDVAVWHSATLSPGNVIGDGCRIHAGCFLELVTLGKRVFLGPSVIFTDDPHPVNPSPRTCFKGAVVGDDVVIGANVTILPHIKIGNKAIIGAGSVVTKDVPGGEVWVGNPARFLKRAEDIICEVDKVAHFPYRDYWNIK